MFETKCQEKCSQQDYDSGVSLWRAAAVGEEEEEEEEEEERRRTISVRPCREKKPPCT